MSELPEGWAIASIGETCLITTGKTPPTKRTELFSGSIPFFKPGDLDQGGTSLETTNYLSAEGAKIARLLPIGSVLVSCIGNLGKTALLGVASSCNQQINAITPPNDINPKFVYYWARTIKEWLEQNSSATTVSIINKERFSKAKLLIPPANEQKRIVAKLEKCEARVEAAREALSDVPKLLEHYRQSVLAAAFRGDLTSDWRTQHSDSEPAEQLLERLRDERRQRWEQAELEKFEAKGTTPPKNWKDRYKAPLPLTADQLKELPKLPEGWCWATLESLTENGNIFDGPFGSKLKTKDYTEAGVRVVRLENIAPLDFIEEKVSYVSNEKYEDLLRHEVFESDIIFSSFIFEPLRVCTIPALKTKAIAKADCLCVRPSFNGIEGSYLCYALSSAGTAKAIKGDIHGATRPRINTTQLRSVPIPVAPHQEQIQISQKIDSSLQMINKLKTNYKISQADLSSLTQSLLAKAFRGELVPQDPNDEPASKLLERIAEKRTKATPKARKRAVKKR